MIIAPLLVALLLALVPATTALRAPIAVIDQQSPSSGSVLGVGTNTFGQSFTPTLSQIDAAELFLSSPTAGATTWQLDVLLGAGLGGPVLGSSSPVMFSDATLSARHFDLAAPVALTPGNAYTLRVSNVSGVEASVLVDTTNQYSGGAYFGPGVPVVTDVRFIEGLHVIPEPSTALLLGAGLLGLGMRRRRASR